MGEAADKLSGKLGIDTTDFKTGISAANRELRVLESGFRASAAELGDWTKSATGLETRIGSLTKQIDVQRLKVAAVREEYERVKAEKGENSKAAQDLEIKLNKETEQLNKMSSELSQTEGALQGLADGSAEAGEEAEEAGGKFEGFKKVLSGTGAIVKGALTVIAGLAVAVAGLGASISGLVFDTAAASAELVDLSAKTGISTERLQELSYVGDQVGTSADTITSSLARMTRSIGDAIEQQADYNAKRAEAIAQGDEFTGELGDAAAAYERLGVSLTGPNGELRSTEDIFYDVINALGQVTNATERDTIAMDILGRSALELNPLIKAGSDELARLSDEAHEVGAVMSEEDVAAFEAFDDTLASLQAGLKGTLGTLAGAFLPGFESVFATIGGYLQEFSSIVRGSDGDINQMVEGIGGLITRIVTDIASQAPQLLQTGVTILQTIITAILTALPTLIPAAVNIILTLLDFIIQNLPLLIDAGIQAIVTLATGLADALPTLIPAIVQAIITIVNTLIANLPLLIDAALQLILGLANGLILALPVLIAALPQIIDALVNGLIQAGPLVLDAAVQLITMLALGILTSIPVAVVALVELISRLGNTLAETIRQAPQRGKDFVRGLADGIKNSAGLLFSAVTNLINGMISKITGLLDMNSPSGVGEDIGGNLIGSLGSGGAKALPSTQRSLEQTMNGIVNTLSAQMPSLGGFGQPAFAGAGVGSSGSGSMIQIGDIYVDARGAKDPKKVGEEVGNTILKKLRSLGGA